MSKKLLIIIISAAVAVIATVSIILAVVLSKPKDNGNNNNGYLDSARTIKIVQIEGSATVTDDEGSSSCFKGMNLYNGDKVNVNADSVLVIKFDEDKYTYLGENTIINIKSEGKDKFKTNIYVEQGKVLAEIQKPLDVDEEFFLSSNNSVMAVRGTIFGVTVLKTQTEVKQTYSVYKGVTELYVFDKVNNEVVKGKLSDISNKKIEVVVPTDKLMSQDEYKEITDNWLKDISKTFDDPADANENLDEVNITVDAADPDDYSGIVDKLQEEISVSDIEYTSKGYFGPFDGRAHKITVTPITKNAKVVYKLESDTAYSDENNFEFTAPGSYRVYYKITCEGLDDKEDFEVISITKPNVIVESDYITYDSAKQVSAIDISSLPNTMFNRFNGVLASEVLKNIKFYIGTEEVSAQTTIKYNQIIDGYIELVDGNNTLYVTFDYSDYAFDVEVNFIFSDTRDDLGYSIGVSNDNLELLSGNLYYLSSSAFTGAAANTMSGNDLLTAFGLDVDDLSLMLINYPLNTLEDTVSTSSYDGTNTISFAADTYNEINFLIMPTATTKGFNETVRVYVGDSKPNTYPSYIIGSLSYGYNQTKNPNGVLMDFVKANTTVTYSLDGQTYNAELYIKDAGSHKVYYKVANGDNAISGFEYVSIVVGQGSITFDNLKFINSPIYLLTTDNNQISYTFSDSDGMTHTALVESPDGRTITSLSDTYQIYTDLVKNAKFYDSITKEIIKATVVVSEKKDGSADFNYTISAEGYDSLTGVVEFEKSQFGYVQSNKYGATFTISPSLPKDLTVSLSDVPTVIPSRIEFVTEGSVLDYQLYYSIDEGKTWTTEVPKITEAGTYKVYTMYCLVDANNNATELVPGTTNETPSTSLAATGNFIVAIQTIVVTE